MKPGKLYRVKKRMATAQYNLGPNEVPVLAPDYDVVNIPVGDIFLFVGSLEVEGHLQTYCKLLYKDKVYITNNEYFINDFVVEYKK